MLNKQLKPISIIPATLFVCMLMYVNVSFAIDWDDKLSLNGYYSIDYTHVDDDLELSGNSTLRRNHQKNKGNFDNSILGGQLKFNFTDNFSVFVQGSANLDRNKSVKTDLDWAYLSYDLGNDLKARIGKFQMPLLSGIELRKIGYARLWARPLIPGNGASGYSDYKGIDIIKNVSTSTANWDFQLAAGKGNHGLNEVDNKNIKLISARYQRDNYWIRAALLETQYTLSTPSRLVITDSGESLLASIESEININQFQLNLGISSSDAKVVPDDAMAYLSLAYRFNNFTPYVYGVKLKQHFPFFVPPLPNNPPGGRPGGEPPGPPVGNKYTDSIGVGIRWDIKPKLSLKFQLENIKEKDKTRIQQNGIVSKDGNALTIILEGVF